ncbi:type II toxin-antitoxin system RelE/ParE family toxin [Loigolactobacillus zhaoyuanensis]|uniref:type II toxin-antitoxin system RelE/ParE family toxin n=1 Tax=Loigolactobacillus zhaoyuanensis TaxID=2486017 RepID=UPI000F739C98|nr:type II toxin-antitoxin system RelE/ParE family toxin [Loigolactobacillus zhaoyuanensis]
MTIRVKQKYVKKLDKNLYEIRSRQGSTIQRGLYFHVANEKYIITHGFTKKTQKTPSNEIAKAKRIRWIYFNRGDHQ